MDAMQRQEAVLPVPKRVYMELTARCDLQCLHCAGAMHERQRGDMDYAFFLRTTALLRGLGVRELGLSYLGEPFLCRWLPEAIHRAKRELGFPFVFLTTNGRLATPERVRHCIGAGLDRLEFEYNFAGPDQFHYVTGGREQDFWKVDVNLLAAGMVRDEVRAATGHRCIIAASTVRLDDEHARRMQHALRRLRRSVDVHVWRPLRGPMARVARSDRQRPCATLFEQAHITFDGRLSACAYDHDPRFEVGDLTAETFLEAWNGERFRSLRTAHLAGDRRGTPCEGCSAWH